MDAGELLDLLGNENRRRILRLLARKPCYVTEISEHLGVSPKAVIDHLRKLETAGLIESRTDEHRRKYFDIVENLRLEVTLAPYGFGMKSAYPANPSLDLSSCQYVSLEATRTRIAHPTDGAGSIASTSPSAEEISRLAAELDELEQIARELSLAQRWVQGRIAAVRDALSETAEANEYLDAEILVTLVRGAQQTSEIASELDLPAPVVEESLARLAEEDIISRVGDGWQLT